MDLFMSLYNLAIEKFLAAKKYLSMDAHLFLATPCFSFGHQTKPWAALYLRNIIAKLAIFSSCSIFSLSWTKYFCQNKMCIA
jgi:hypothetical protein